MIQKRKGSEKERGDDTRERHTQRHRQGQGQGQR